MYPTTNRSNDEYQKLIHALAWNDGFGCYTRAGFEKLIWPEIAEKAKWIIYFDLDNIHALNETYGGYDAVDQMVKASLGVLRLTDYVAGQFKSGDEFLICITDEDISHMEERRGGIVDPWSLVERLTDALKLQGMSATFAIVPVISKDLVINVQPAIDEVYANKKRR